MSEPREFTKEEVRDLLLSHIVNACRYWATETRVTSIEDRLQGLAFTILATLDGSAGLLPAFPVGCAPQKDDKAFFQKQGENWFPATTDLGALHDFWYEAVRRAKRIQPEHPENVVDADPAWKAKTPYERLADLLGAAEAKRIRG